MGGKLKAEVQRLKAENKRLQGKTADPLMRGEPQLAGNYSKFANTVNAKYTADKSCKVRKSNSFIDLLSGLVGRRDIGIEAHDIDYKDDITAYGWYDACHNVQAPWGGWFGLWDCLCRYLSTIFAFYWCMITSPFSFAYYTYKYNQTWYGYPGLMLTAIYPVLPFGIVLMELAKKAQKQLNKVFNPNMEASWDEAGPGRVFFVKPDSMLADWLWSFYLTTSMFVGQFWLAGTHPDAISHTWVDTILTKDFWRAALESVEARVPRELGRWTGSTLNVFHELNCSDLVIKVPDGYLGIGDSFWNYGTDYSSLEELELKLQQQYSEQEVLVLEMVRPRKDLGVHSLDILTVRTPDDGVKVLSVLLWTNCTTDSSHSCQEGYMVDVESETIVGAANWYCAAFAEMNAPLVGTKYPGVREACEKAVAAHNKIEEQWLVAVGWDAMVMPKSEIVFFEGNFAGARTPRRMFLSASAMCSAVWNVFWPFGQKNSVTPHALSRHFIHSVIPNPKLPSWATWVPGYFSETATDGI